MFFKSIYQEKTVAVLEFIPNSWGLFQMHGNVWEWCEDVFESDYSDSKGLGLDNSASQRVLRGGSWLNGARLLRSANRIAVC